MNYQKQSEIFSILSNPIRLKILHILNQRETSLEELSEQIGIRKPNTSQHLAIMRYQKIIKVRKDGQRAMYSIRDKNIKKYLK